MTKRKDGRREEQLSTNITLKRTARGLERIARVCEREGGDRDVCRVIRGIAGSLAEDANEVPRPKSMHASSVATTRPNAAQEREESEEVVDAAESSHDTVSGTAPCDEGEDE